MWVSELTIYPVKSTRGLALQSAAIGSTGFEHDRRWMLVDAGGRFITQRQYPRMVLITAQPADDHLRLQAEGCPELIVPKPDKVSGSKNVQVWKDVCDALDAGDEAARWCSDFLEIDCRLVYMPEETVRPVDPVYAMAGDRTGFADGFPFLLTTHASLDDLNSRLEFSVPMTRFRPNIVIKGAQPYAEDSWKKIRIGTVTFRVSKPCSRCVMTTVDTEKAVKTGKEPLMTLSRYRKTDSGVIFGQNLVHDDVGIIRVGDTVEILE